MNETQRAAGILTLAAIMLAVLLAVHDRNEPANALQTTPPPYTKSWYVTKLADGDAMESRGAADGAYDVAQCSSSGVKKRMVVLIIGQPERSGTGGVYHGYGVNEYSLTAPFRSFSVVKTAIQRYTAGYFNSSGGCTGMVTYFALSVNNQRMCTPPVGICDTDEHANELGNLVGDLRDFMVTNGRSGRIQIWGGNDMETEGKHSASNDGHVDWDCATVTKAYTDAYEVTKPGSTDFIDSGTAWPLAHPDYYPQCWDVPSKAYKAYKVAERYPLPEIYKQSALDTWVDLSASHSMYFVGVISECPYPISTSTDFCTQNGNPSEFKPWKAWDALWDELQARTSPQASLDYATNIGFQP